MKKLFTLTMTLFMAIAFLSAQTVAVTFQVDMSNETVSPDGVHIAGSLNGWSPDATMLTDQGGGIYAVTMDLTPGNDYEYKYINGNAWGAEETPPLDCSVGGNNRIFTTPASDFELPLHPFGGCPDNVPTQMVTFQVDMSNETVSPNGVHVAGNFNGWSPGAVQLLPGSGNIYQVTVPVLSYITVLQYKFVNGNDWGFEEDPPDDCANGSNNRIFVLEGAGDMVTLPIEVFGGCENPLPTKPVTFSVDLDGTAASADGVHVAGDFQGWNPGATTMTNVGGDLYEVTFDIPVATASIQYKYVNGNDWGFEEDPPDDCANNDNNRVAILPISTDPIALPTYKFGTCEEVTSSTTELLPASHLEVFPLPANHQIHLLWTGADLSEKSQILLYDLSGQVVRVWQDQFLISGQQISLNIESLKAGMYLLQLRTEEGIVSRKVIKQ